jgi:NADH:ubiquinone oxidoreductase subunit 4 (subunit M)
MSTFLQNPLTIIPTLLAVTLGLTLVLPARKLPAIRYVILSSSLLSLVMGVIACLAFDKSSAGFQFLATLNFIPEYNLGFTLGADGLSMVFLLLTLFIFPILFLSA